MTEKEIPSPSKAIKKESPYGITADATTTNEASSSPKVWFITNCGALLGRIIAQTALSRGHSVAACARERHIPDLYALSLQYLDKCLLIECDVRNIPLCQSAVALTLEKCGRIDVVVNTASKTFVGAVEEVSDWNFREQMEVNFFGTVNIVRAVMPTLRRQRSGHIVNITGLTGQIGTPSLALLSAAHHAVEGYSESLSFEVAPFNIKVTVVQPPIDTIVLPNQMIFVPALPHYKSTPTGKIRRLLDQSTKLSTTSAEQTAAVILTICALPNPPPRVAVRQDSLDQIKDKLRTLSEEMEVFTATTISADVQPCSSSS